jgi:hypothetical protein
MTNLRTLTAALALSIPLIACADDHPSVTRVAWLDECPSTPDLTKVQGFSAVGVALVAAIGTKLIDGAIDTAASALKAAGESKSASSTARSFQSFYYVNQMADVVPDPSLRCVVVVRGKFTNEASGNAFPWADKSLSIKGLQAVDFRFEAAIRPVTGLKSFQLVPVYAELARAQENSWWSQGAKARDYTVSVAMQAPGTTSPFASTTFVIPQLKEGTPALADDWRLAQQISEPLPFPAPPIDVEAMRVRREKAVAPLLLAVDILTPAKAQDPAPNLYAQDESKVRAALKALCTGQSAFNATLPREQWQLDARCAQEHEIEARRVALDQELATALRSPKAAGRSGRSLDWATRICQPKTVPPKDGPETDCQAFKTDDKLTNATYSPFTTNITVVETRDGNKFLGYLGKALGDSKESLGKEIASRVLPDKKDPAGDEARDRAASRALAFADLEVERAGQALAEALEAKKAVSEITAARVILLKAKVAANDAYRAAGRPVPYPEAD